MQARLAAAKAFRVLCVRCAAKLSSPAVLSGLVGLSHTALNSQQVATQGELRVDQCILHGVYEACCSRHEQVHLSARQGGSNFTRHAVADESSTLNCTLYSVFGPSPFANFRLQTFVCALQNAPHQPSPHIWFYQTSETNTANSPDARSTTTGVTISAAMHTCLLLTTSLVPCRHTCSLLQ